MPRDNHTDPPRLTLDPISIHERVKAAKEAIYNRARDLAMQAESMRLAAAPIDSRYQDPEQVLRAAIAFQGQAAHLGYQVAELATNAGNLEALIEILQAAEVSK